MPELFISARPIASETQAMVLAVNWPPQAPALGQATRSRMSSAASDMVPFWLRPTASNMSCTVRSRVRKSSGISSSIGALPGRIEPP